MSNFLPTPVIFRNGKQRRKVRPTRTPRTDLNGNKKYKSKINNNHNRKLLFENDSDSEIENNEPNNFYYTNDKELLNSMTKLSLKKDQKTKSLMQSKYKYKNLISITQSERIFNKKHEFKKLLIEAKDIGSGCSLYLSSWDNKHSGIYVYLFIFGILF